MTSQLAEPLADTADTGYHQSCNVQRSATVESVPTSKKMISRDKSKRCKNSFRQLKSLPTSAVDLTGRGQDFEPYWNESSAEKSAELWSPTVTDFAGLASNFWSGYSCDTVASSWFSTKVLLNQSVDSLKTSQRLSTAFPVDCTESVQLVRSKLIRLRPTKQQRKILKHWLDGSRWFYNQAVQMDVRSWMPAKKFMVTNNTPSYFKDVPFQVRGCAIKSYTEALRVAFKTAGKNFKMKFKSRKNPRQTAFIPKTAVKSRSFYVTSLGDDLRPSEPIQTDGDCLLVLQDGKFYIQVTSKCSSSENQAMDIVSIDPGVRTFLTVFSPTCVAKLADKSATYIYRLCLHLDKLISNKVCGKAVRRLRKRIKNLLTEMHHKVARWLVNNFGTIVYPAFDVSRLVMKAGRKIGRKSVRQMLTLGHASFRQILFDKCVETGTTLVYVSEAYTSKTCSCCGKIHDKLGPNSVLNCCQRFDRDINGARGILLRALRDTSVPVVVQT